MHAQQGIPRRAHAAELYTSQPPARQQPLRSPRAGSNALGKSLTPLPAPRPGAALVTDGLYKHVRHPMYAGLLLVSGGFAAVTLDPTRALFAAALLVLLSFKAAAEEERLVDTYGDDYERYMAAVKRFGVF